MWVRIKRWHLLKDCMWITVLILRQNQLGMTCALSVRV